MRNLHRTNYILTLRNPSQTTPSSVPRHSMFVLCLHGPPRITSAVRAGSPTWQSRLVGSGLGFSSLRIRNPKPKPRRLRSFSEEMASIATALANMARMKDQLRCSGVVGAHTWRRGGEVGGKRPEITREELESSSHKTGCRTWRIGVPRTSTHWMGLKTTPSCDSW